MFGQLPQISDLEQAIISSPLVAPPDASLQAVIDVMHQSQRSCPLTIAGGLLHSRLNLERVGCVLVMQDAQLLGLVTEQEMAQQVATRSNLVDISIGEVITQQPMTLLRSQLHNIFTVISLFHQHRMV